MPGTRENPFTHSTGPSKGRQYKECKCSVCGIVARCEPRFDFFVEDGTGENDNKPLVCETCFTERLPGRVDAGQFAVKRPNDGGPPVVMAAGKRRN